MNPIDKCKDQFKKCKITAGKKMAWDYDDPWVNAEVVDVSPPPAKPPQDKYAVAAEEILGTMSKPMTAKLKKKRRKRKRSKYKKSKQRLKSKKKKKKSIRRKIRKTKKLKK